MQLIAFLAGILFTGLSAQTNSADQVKIAGGFSAGYNRGFGVHADVTGINFAKELPFRLRFGVGLTFLNPGNAADARRIFVNDNTNGTPEKKGRSFDFRLDFLMARRIFGINSSSFVFGPRFSTFNGDFKYVGGNEDFEVKSHQWGAGAGFENYFRISPKLNLVISYGLDIYAPSTLTGHDSSYSPDNDNINPKRDERNDESLFRYGDANRAIKQPFIMPHIMFGINFGL